MHGAFFKAQRTCMRLRWQLLKVGYFILTNYLAPTKQAFHDTYQIFTYFVV